MESAKMNRNDEILASALKLNWDHARHIETLRLRLTTVYIIAILGAGLAALKGEVELIKQVAAVLGLLISIFCWAMTHKWNAEFVNQIQSADRCARKLRLEDGDEGEVSVGEEVHSYIGFPKPAPFLSRLINVRRMFHLFYVVFIGAWVFVSLYSFSLLPAPSS